VLYFPNSETTPMRSKFSGQRPARVDQVDGGQHGQNKQTNKETNKPGGAARAAQHHRSRSHRAEHARQTPACCVAAGIGIASRLLRCSVPPPLVTTCRATSFRGFFRFYLFSTSPPVDNCLGVRDREIQAPSGAQARRGTMQKPPLRHSALPPRPRMARADDGACRRLHDEGK
jgi:hypothetical protein